MTFQLTPQQMQRLAQLNKEQGEKNNSIASNDLDASNTSGVSPEILAKIDALNKKNGIEKQLQHPLTAAIGEKSGALIDPAGDAKDLFQGAVQGGINLGGLVNKVETAGANKLFGSNLKAPDVSDIAAPLGSGNSGFQANLSRGIGEYLVPGGAAKKAITEFAEPVSLLGKILSQGKASTLGSMITEGTAGATSGVTNAPDGSRGMDGLINGIVGALTPGALKGAEALRPSKLLRGTLSPEELQANVDAAKGTKTNLGDVIQNATLMKRYKNEIAPSLFSGARDDMQGVYDEIQNRGKGIVSNEIGTTMPAELHDNIDNTASDALKTALQTDDLSSMGQRTNQTGDNLITSLFGSAHKDSIDQNIFDDLNESFQATRAQKNLNYATRDAAADNDPEFEMNTPKFSALAKSLDSNLKDTVFLKNEPAFKSFMNKINNYKKTRIIRNGQIPDNSGYNAITMLDTTQPATRTTIRPTLTEATSIKSMLNGIATKNLRSLNPQDQYLGGQFSSLAKALHDDINDSISASGNPEIRELHDEANKHYVENYLPYKNKEINPYLTGEKNSDGIASKLADISSSLKIGRTKSLLERPNQLTSSYFIKSRGSDGISNHEKLTSLIDSAEKLPSYNVLVNNPDSRHMLSSFKNLSNTTSFTNKFLSNDGSINHESLDKQVKILQKDPDLYQRLIPTQEGREALNNFSSYYNKTKSYKSMLKGDGSVNIAQLNNLTKKILSSPHENSSKMTSDGIANALRLQRLTKMNPSSDAPMFNPPTGKTSLDALSTGIGASLGALLGGAPGAAIGAMTPGMLIRPLAKTLTSEKVRESLVKEMLKNRTRIYTPKKIQAASTLSQGIANALQGNN